MKSMVKNSIYNVLYTLANVVFSLISSIYASRILQPEGIGKYSYALTFATYFVSLASLGIQVYGVREIAKVRDKTEEKNRIFSELFLINLATSCLAFFLYLFVIYQVQAYKEDLGLYLRFGLLIAANILNIDWLYKGEESYGYITLRSIIVKTCSMILLVLWVHDAGDVNRYADITVLASCGNYIYNVLHAKRIVHFTVKDLQLARHMKPNMILAVSFFFGELYNKIDITMLGMFSTDYAVGIYSNAHKIVNIVISCCIAATGTFLPRLSSAIKADKNEATSIVNKGLDVLTFLCVPFMLGLCAISKRAILLLYGDAFSDAAITVNVLAALVIIRGIGDLVCYQLLIATGKEKLRVPANVITAVLNISMNSLLIPVLRENGAALASVLSELFVNGFLYVRMKKEVPFRFKWAETLKVLIASIMMFAFAYAIGQLNIPLLLSIAVSVLGSVVIYIGLNWLMKNETLIHAFKQVNGNMLAKRNR